MTDNRTTELRISEPLRGFIRHQSNRAYIDGGQVRWLTKIADEIDAKHEQAIAATLGSERHPCEQRITGDGSDWGEIMRDAYDDLMASACESCTPEQMEQLADYIRAELGSGTLTAEQVREAVMSADRWEKPMGDTGLTNTHLIIRDDGWQAIADELNAAMGGSECENVSDEPQYFQCSECRGRGTIRKAFDNGSRFSFCPDCGAKVRKAVGR